jgi:hypothetical protein
VPAPADWLDRPLQVLNLGRRDYAPLTWRDELGLAGLAFTDHARARRHLDRVRAANAARAAADAARATASQRAATGRRPTPAPSLLTLGAGDLRAREEWLRAVMAAGAARVRFDLQGVPPFDEAAFELTAALLAEVLSHKRGLACL